MANWYGTARSNYVKVKDLEALKKALAPFDIEISADEDRPGLVCLLSEDGDSGGWPSFGVDENGEEVEFDVAELICPLLEEKQILVMKEAGAEKLRYITGSATAWNHEGKWVAVNLDDIYKRAAKKFKVPQASITDCSY